MKKQPELFKNTCLPTFQHSPMNKFPILFSLLILASCTATSPQDEQAKRDQIAEYKQEMNDLKLKIETLEKELDSAQVVQSIPVKVTEVQPQIFEHFVEVTGKVEADQEVDVSPEISGKITQIDVKEGDKVAKGNLLATLNTDIMQRSIEEAEIALELASTTYERQKNLWDQKIGSEMQYLLTKSNKESMERRVESLRDQLDMARVVSPVDGIVDVIYQKRGEIAGPQAPFAKVVNISKLKIYGDVSESHLVNISVGERVLVDFPALERQITTPIVVIGNYIDPNNRTFRIRLNINNPDQMIKPNMVSVLKIRDYISKNALVVPALLIKNDFRGQYTYIAEPMDSSFVSKKIYVTTGVSQNNRVEVLKGLQPGAKIISEGYDQVADGTAISIQ